ncbi:hypothetical protein Taro_019934, partial [Colocasia esculenta]|nr:hypothetical protein [Colocasia esculenta]
MFFVGSRILLEGPRSQRGPKHPLLLTPPSFYRSEGGEEEGDRRWGHLRLGVPTGDRTARFNAYRVKAISAQPSRPARQTLL